MDDSVIDLCDSDDDNIVAATTATLAAKREPNEEDSSSSSSSEDSHLWTAGVYTNYVNIYLNMTCITFLYPRSSPPSSRFAIKHAQVAS